MTTDSGERRLIKPFDLTPEQQQEPLPCPRCDSPNTKFCYFNNYNLAQPRHFCKSCRRYWTQGGALRNIPVGGGTRKNSTKRSRTTSSTTITSTPTPTATTSSSSTSPQQEPIPANPISFHPANITSLSLPMFAPGYTSLLNTTQVVPGFLGMNGFGLGLGGAGFDEMGVWNLGLGLGDVGESTSAVNLGGGGGGGVNGGNMWQQLGIGGDGGFGDTECSASWPELAISTPRKGVK